ncbi:MAG: hypothetical protein IT563_18500 [Alphaproteobacteria bacterium]|nr:hypothetical protein [Alphaproteobacteria bacterium]
MSEKDYFTVERTALRIPKCGAQAIVCGDKPRKNDDGTTSYSLRAPMLLIPPDLFDDADNIMQKVASILNDHAHEFFDSARSAEGKQSLTRRGTDK